MNDAQLAYIEMQNRVWSNLDDALSNEYDVRDWSVEDIVIDLLCFASDLEDIEDTALIEPHVKSWLEARRNVQ